ncbi:MAG: penicillin-binding protein [Nitratireductor sp.]|nr:penicillin-binding protein [Nitratireductor sp.]
MGPGERTAVSGASPRPGRGKPAPRGGKSRSRGGGKGRARRPSTRRGLFGFVRFAAYWGMVLGIWGFLGLVGIFAWYGAQLPTSASWKVPDRPPNARIVSVEGKLIANRGVTGGESMPLDEMSPYIPMAVIAIEDRRFQSHFGIDPLGIVRAMAENLFAGRLVQGGSTLTQQLAKNLFLEPRRDLERKVQEAIIAVWLEQKYTKDEILEVYLNRVYFGSGAYRVDAAARRYFNKSARDVNLAEAALLAGLLKAPSALSPAKNPKGAEERAQVVLGAMRREGFVTDREVAAALSLEAKQAKRYWTGSEHYVADMVMKQLHNIVGDLKGDVIVDTTIDLDLQKRAGQLIKQAIAENGEKRKVSQGALVSMDGTGAVRALVGGVEYADSQFNRAVDARRQPGSAFKPVVYLAAIEAGLNPQTVRVDRPVTIGTWSPENYDHKFRGPVTLSEALSQSLNTIAAQLVAETGPAKVIEAAHRLGIDGKLARNASIALGTSEVSLIDLTSAYTPFSNGGYLAEPFLIKRIVTRDGKVLYERNAPAAPLVVNPLAVGMMNEMLERAVSEGTGRKANFKGWQVAGKTGTTQNSRDAWFVGYTANLVTGVWFGNDDGKPTAKLTGGSLPAETFRAFMEAAHKGVPVAALPGYGVPQTVSSIPSPRPQSGFVENSPPAGRLPAMNAAPSASRDQGVAQVAAPARKPLSEVGGAPVPGKNVGQSGQQRPRPRNIFELLLGG